MTDLPEALAPADYGLRSTRRQVLLGGALLATAGVAWARMPRVSTAVVDPKKIESIVPMTVGGWFYETKSGLVLPPPDQLSAQLYDQVLTRVYGSVTDLPVMLLIAYGSSQDGMLQVHRPEVCYPAGGYSLSDTENITVPVSAKRVVPARFFTAVGQQRTEQLIYWTRIGESFPRSWGQQRYAVMVDNLEGTIPDGVLVRMSTVSDDPKFARDTLTRFAADLVAAAPPLGRAMLLGRSGA
jgi:EpsI family protein